MILKYKTNTQYSKFQIPNSKFQIPNSKIQNTKSKIQNPQKHPLYLLSMRPLYYAYWRLSIYSL